MTDSPDYMIEFDRDWRHLVTDEHGNLDVDKIARELSDFSRVMDNASRVYEELSGLSKPLTDPAYVLQGAEDRYAETYADYLCEHADSAGTEGLSRERLIAIANEWAGGAWETYQVNKAQRGAYPPRQEQP